jgi:large subunit ribosomal protein L5
MEDNPKKDAAPEAESKKTEEQPKQQPKPKKADKGPAQDGSAGKKPKGPGKPKEGAGGEGGAKPEKKAKEPKAPRPPARLKNVYKQTVVPELSKKFGYKNPMQVPQVTKVVLNMGLGGATQNIKLIDNAVAELSAITGQKPVVTKAKKSIANFKLRQGMQIGAMVTLRREIMYEFLDRFFNIALPRVRDFRGLSAKGFDGRGSYSMGIREQIIFPEIHYDKVERIQGMNITIVTTAKTDEEAKELLKLLGMPFRDN